MDEDEVQEGAARDQLWASLRALLPDIERLAGGQFSGSERERQVVHVLARVILAELEFRERRSEPE